jgi:hypothetical protein
VGAINSRRQCLIALVLLSALLARLPVSAQDVAPSSADSGLLTRAHTGEALTAPQPPSVVVEDPARPPLAFVAPRAIAIAWQELHELQRREAELWRQGQSRVALPAVGLGVGLSAFVVMLPIGSIMLLNAREGTEASEAERLTRMGGPLVFFGMVGLAAFVTSAAALARIHKRRVRREKQIKALVGHRLLLENELEGGWRAIRGAPR